MEKLLDFWDKEKKEKHGKQCHKQRKHFSPFVLPVDGMLGMEALFVLTNLSRLMAKKLRNPFYTYVVGSAAVLKSRLQGRTPA